MAAEKNFSQFTSAAAASEVTSLGWTEPTCLGSSTLHRDYLGTKHSLGNEASWGLSRVSSRTPPPQVGSKHRMILLQAPQLKTDSSQF